MKHFFLLLLSGVASCSRESASPVTKSEPFHQYASTFAAVKIPDDFVQAHGCVIGTNGTGFNFASMEARHQLAAYVLAHTNEFSFLAPAGNFVPIVGTHQETHVKLILDPQQEAADFEKYGMRTTSLQAGVAVQGEDGNGWVICSWPGAFLVHLKEPVGNSTDQGGDGSFIGDQVIPAGVPDMAPLFHTKGITLWEVVRLDRLQ